MDRTTKLESIQKELKEIKEKEPQRLEEATSKLAELIKKYPSIKDNGDLKLMIAFTYLRAGDKIMPIIDKAFEPPKLQYDFLQVKRSEGAKESYLFTALDVFVQKLERAHNVYVLKKSNTREVEVQDRNDPDVNRKAKVMDLSLWVDDMKAIAVFPIWDAAVPFYEVMKASQAYSMQLNYNGKDFFPAKDPMLKDLKNFQPNWSEMVKFISEKYPEMKEPFSADGYADRTKSFVMMGRATRDVNGNIFVTPNVPTTSSIAIQRTADTRDMEDGDDILILGNIVKSRPFKGRDGKDIPPISDYTIFPAIVLRISPQSTNGNNTPNNNSSSESEEKKTSNGDIKAELGL